MLNLSKLNSILKISDPHSFYYKDSEYTVLGNGYLLFRFKNNNYTIPKSLKNKLNKLFPNLDLKHEDIKSLLRVKETDEIIKGDLNSLLLNVFFNHEYKQVKLTNYIYKYKNKHYRIIKNKKNQKKLVDDRPLDVIKNIEDFKIYSCKFSETSPVIFSKSELDNWSLIIFPVIGIELEEL